MGFLYSAVLSSSRQRPSSTPGENYIVASPCDLVFSFRLVALFHPSAVFFPLLGLMGKMALGGGGKMAILFGLLLVCGVGVRVTGALVDVALVEFVLWGNKTTTSLGMAGALFDIGEEELTQKYGNVMNVSRVRIFDRNVTTCELMDQKATFWATRYFYREAVVRIYHALYHTLYFFHTYIYVYMNKHVLLYLNLFIYKIIIFYQ